jgi:imidazolonepropionase-like amidohydrolase
MTNTVSKLNSRLRIAFTATLALFAGTLVAEAQSGGSTLITDATVHTMGADGTLENADVLITDGKIAAVGADLTAPEGATTIDGSGKIVTPGFMESFSSIGLVEVSAVRETRDDNSGSSAPYSASVDPVYGINPDSTLIPVTRLEGVTRAVTSHNGNVSLFSGLGAVIHLGNGPDLVVKQGAAQYVDLSSGSMGVAGGSRLHAWALFEDALDAAKTLSAKPGFFTPKATASHPVLSAKDLNALGPVATGDMPLVVYVNRAADIRRVLAVAKERELNVALLRAAEGWRVADEIAEAGVPVIIRAFDNLPGQFERLTARLDNAAQLHEAGVTIAFTQFDTHQTRLLPQSAGNAVANGLPYDAALAAMTINPAKIYGIDDTYGSLEVGKDADVVVWSGDPLELTTSAEAVFIRGEAMPMTSRQTVLRDRYMSLERGNKPHQYR